MEFDESDFGLSNFEVTLGPKIGEGQFSVVYIGKYFGDYVAVKKQTREENNIEQYLLRELAVLKHVQHSSLMGYIGAWNEVNENGCGLNAVYIVTEFCQGGDLTHLLISKNELGWKFRIKIAMELASALVHLHEKKIIHRDIKSSNILLDHNWNSKITDFGMAREVPGEKGAIRCMTICGTNDYMAPELLFDEPYNMMVDIFSLGVVYLELLTRKIAGQDGFASRSPRDGFQLDIESIRTYLPTNAPPSLEALALQCLSYQKEERPSPEDITDWLFDLWNSSPDDDLPLPPLPTLPPFSPENSRRARHSVVMQISSPSTPVLNSSSIHASLETSSAIMRNSCLGDIVESEEENNISNNNSNHSSRYSYNTNDISTSDLINSSKNNNNNSFNNSINDNSVEASYQFARLSLDQSTVESDIRRIKKTHLLVEGSEAVVKSGHLLKRNNKGLRYWKPAYFVLTDTHLKFQILEHGKEHVHTNDTVSEKIYNRELSGSNKLEMEEWVRALSQVILSLPVPPPVRSDRGSMSSVGSYLLNASGSPSSTPPPSTHNSMSSLVGMGGSGSGSNGLLGRPTMKMMKSIRSLGAGALRPRSRSKGLDLGATDDSSSIISEEDKHRQNASTGKVTVKFSRSNTNTGLFSAKPPDTPPPLRPISPLSSLEMLPVEHAANEMMISLLESKGNTFVKSGKPNLYDLYVSLEHWLSALQLPVMKYLPEFQREGYTDLRMIAHSDKISESSLDKLHVTHPLHRRVLATASHCCFSKYVLICVPEWRENGHDQPILFKVVSRYRYHRSTVMLCQSDFIDFDELLRSVVKSLSQETVSPKSSRPSDADVHVDGTAAAAPATTEESLNATVTESSPPPLLNNADAQLAVKRFKLVSSSLMARIPPLPGKSNTLLTDSSHLRDPMNANLRRLSLENYLHRIADLLTDTPLLPLLLHRLGIIPFLPLHCVHLIAASTSIPNLPLLKNTPFTPTSAQTVFFGPGAIRPIGVEKRHGSETRRASVDSTTILGNLEGEEDCDDDEQTTTTTNSGEKVPRRRKSRLLSDVFNSFVKSTQSPEKWEY